MELGHVISGVKEVKDVKGKSAGLLGIKGDGLRQGLDNNLEQWRKKSPNGQCSSKDPGVEEPQSKALVDLSSGQSLQSGSSRTGD